MVKVDYVVLRTFLVELSEITAGNILLDGSTRPILVPFNSAAFGDFGSIIGSNIGFYGAGTYYYDSMISLA